MKTAEDLFYVATHYKDHNISKSTAIGLMEEYAAQFQEKERKPEFEICGHCGAQNCRYNETCIKCDKLRTWIP